MKFIVFFALTLNLFSVPLFAQIELEDQNGDGEVRAVAIGDSITFGVGDGVPSGVFVENASIIPGVDGYPGRLSAFLNIPIVKRGVPGEILTEQGAQRFAREVTSASADYVFILEGSNDAIFQVDSGLFRAVLQKLINISRVLNAVPVLMTLPPTYSDRDSLRPFLQSYSREVRELAAVNELLFVDIEAAFTAVCPSSFSCALMSTPEGLHPNSDGYDLIARTAAEAITGESITPEEEAPEEEAPAEESLEEEATS